MTVLSPPLTRPLPRSRLDRLVPPLVASQALVALVPATADLRWAAAAAWDVARAAAQGGRRVALVDLRLESPVLHEAGGGRLGGPEGIVDAFEFGVSLTQAAHDIGGVFFIPAGSETQHADELLAQPRWRKLQAGFRNEGALLLLFCPAASLAKLGAVPDGVLVLGPEDVELHDATLLGTVRERWTPPPPTPSPRPSHPRRLQARRASRRQAVLVGLALTGLTGLIAGGWALFARGAEATHTRAAPAVPLAAIAVPHADSAGWTVQLAAYGTLPKALAHADRLAGAQVGAFVTPIALDATGTVWYRVLAGAYATRDSAAAAREVLWRLGLAPRGQGELLRAPYSFAVDSTADLAGLRTLGVPAVRWDGSASNAGRRLVGAFETPEQAALADAQLKRAGVHAILVTRTGTTP